MRVPPMKETYTNSIHEGTNTVLIFYAGAVVPVNTFDITLTSLPNQVKGRMT